MATANITNDLQRANFRLCRLCIWPNYGGLGFNLENMTPPPHLIRTVESNSPAAAGGLRILDVILAVNNQDVTNSDYKTVTQVIKDARDHNDRIELLVIQRRFYEIFKAKGTVFNPTLARIIDTPARMPPEYTNFPKYTPRTCDIRMNRSDQSFGFEVVNGARDIGMSIQDVIPNSPASRTTLRKSDRVLEVDDNFVDNERSEIILQRLTKAKKKNKVKLYVVDTNTYKHFQETNIPLPSKDFRKSTFARQNQQQPPASTYINVEDISNEPPTADVGMARPTFPTSVGRNIPQSTRTDNSSTRESFQDDIRLCTITRASPTDTYGIELTYHRVEQYHTLKLRAVPNNTPSNAALAGVKNNDHLIEINDENIENISDDEVKRRITSVRYPTPLKVLVADHETYNYYKQQNKVIHSGLPTIRKLPSSTELPRRQPSIRSTPTTIPALVDNPLSSVSHSTNVGTLPSVALTSSSEIDRRQYQLKHIPGFRGYGFSVNSHQGVVTAHKINEILPNSPAAQQGLRVGDNILSVNNQDVTQMNAVDFNRFLRTSAQNAETQGQPLLLEVINDDSYRPSSMPVTSLSRRTPPDSPVSTLPKQRDLPRKDSYSQPIELERARDVSRKSSSTERTISHHGSQRLPTTQLTNSQDEKPKLPSTRPTISREESHRSSAIPSVVVAYQNIPSTQPTSIRPYTNGYDTSQYDQNFRPDIKPNETVSSSSPLLYRSRENLTRGAVDVVSKNRLLRYCRLISGPSQAFGFKLKADNNNNHIIYDILPESPAFRAGLNENDRLLEVDDENVEDKSSREVAILIRNAAANGKLRVLIIPNSVKVLSKRSSKSLTALNNIDNYRYLTTKSKYDDQKSLSTDKYRSISRLNDEQNYRNRLSYLSEPSEPLPRKCVLQHDSSFRGCGFRLIEKENYDTPIIIEVSPNSPAKRSGLTEGDHIIYVDSQNVQNFRSFNDIIHLIQHSFEQNGQIELITLTDPAYHILRKRGGYLDNIIFDYQSLHNINQLKPRLYKLKLYNHEYDFGFTLEQTANNDLYVKNLQIDSPADINGLQKNDIILELNGRTVKHLPINQIKQILEKSEQERKLDLLVIDPDGYNFSIKHAIPLNSLLPFVQTGEGQITTSNYRLSRQPIYL